MRNYPASERGQESVIGILHPYFLQDLVCWERGLTKLAAILENGWLVLTSYLFNRNEI